MCRIIYSFFLSSKQKIVDYKETYAKQKRFSLVFFYLVIEDQVRKEDAVKSENRTGSPCAYRFGMSSKACQCRE